MLLDIAEGLELDPSLPTTFTGLEKEMWNRLKFIENSITTELIELLLRKDRLESILRFCASGHAPLKVVVDEIEVFAEKNSLVVNGRLPDEWKQDVGRMSCFQYAKECCCLSC